MFIIGKEDQVPEKLGSSIDYDRLYSDKDNKVFIEIIKAELDNNSFKHSYIVDKFSMETRLKLNKAPTQNKRP